MTLAVSLVQPGDPLADDSSLGAVVEPATDWWVYVLRCRDGTFYTGITTDLTARLRQHNGDDRGGARYTRGRRPVTLHAACPVAGRPAALRLERSVKGLSRAAKEALPRAAGWR